ncbi:MAG: TIM barrel protein [Candidatus Aenigmatarchaeota archaeon]
MQKILLGPAGTPAKDTLNGSAECSRLGLQAMEVQFSHGIKMGLDLAEKVGDEAKKYDISLSVHAPFFINLVSDDKQKLAASKKRILDSCHLAHLMSKNNKVPVVFHTAYFGKKDKHDVHINVISMMSEIMEYIEKKGWDGVLLAPETTGKHSAHGSLDEILDVAKKTGCGFCVDLAHLYARQMGKLDFREVLEKIVKVKRKHYHFHFSGIEFSKAGERYHKVLDHSPDFRLFAKELLKSRVNATIISESPITWKDSLKMKKILEKIGYDF